MCGTTYCTDCEEFTVPEENGCCPYCETVLDADAQADWQDGDDKRFWEGFHAEVASIRRGAYGDRSAEA